MSDDFTRSSISLPKPVLIRGRKNAKARFRSFSGYVAELIMRDAPAQPFLAASKAPERKGKK